MEGLLSQKKPEFNDLQPVQIVKNAKIRRFIIRKAFSGEKIKDVVWQRGINCQWN